MIRVVQGYSLEDPGHCAMFEDRRHIFVDLLGWKLPLQEGRFEIDQFDGDRAVYLIASDKMDLHCGSLRLLPTEAPHILGALFPQLVDGIMPRGCDVLEITRLCLPTRLGAAARLAVRNRLISAMTDHCLATGIRTLTGVVRSGFRAQILTMGWDAEPLGPIVEIDGLALGAFVIDLDADTPKRLARNAIYSPDTIRVPAHLKG